VTQVASARILPRMFAYIDPNSGSLLIQAAIAGMVALPFFFRKQVARFTSALRRGRNAQDVPTLVAPPSSDGE
jgi:hypothetical protein